MFGKSIFAGIFIAIGSLIYAKIGGPVGAVLFSVGLLSILVLELKLYTGMIGFVDSKESFMDSLTALFGNAIGSFILIPYANSDYNDIIINKYNNNLLLTFISACICGMLIYAAVCAYRKGYILVVILCVAGFIMFGAEHSIADMCYISLSTYYSPRIFLFLPVVIIGNGCGAYALHQIARK